MRRRRKKEEEEEKEDIKTQHKEETKSNKTSGAPVLVTFTDPTVLMSVPC